MEVIGEPREESTETTDNPQPPMEASTEAVNVKTTTAGEAQPSLDEAGTLPAQNLDTAAVAVTKDATGLPVVARTADLAQPKTKRWPVLASMALCFLLSFSIYVSLIPRFTLYSNPPTGDQPFYLMDALSLVQDGDLNLANNYQNNDFDKFYKYQPPGFVGMTAPYPLTPMLANTVRPQNEQYSFHLPGLSLWLAPAWAIGGLFSNGPLPLYWPATLVLMCLIGALVGLNVFLLAHELTGKLWIAWAVWLPIAFSDPVMIYSYLIFTELPVGLLLIYAFRRLALGWGANGPLRLILVGVCIGYIPWLAWRCVPIAALLALYGAIQYVRYRSPETPALTRWNSIRAALGQAVRGAPKTLWFFVPLALSAGGLLWYNNFMFGRPAPDNSVLEQGRVAIFYWPWQSMDNLAKFVTAIFGLLFDQNFGLLVYAPIYLLAVVGIIAMIRLGRGSDRRILLWTALFSVPYLAVICSFYAWHGVWCPPARYLATFVPLLAAPLAMSLYVFSRFWLSWIAYGVLYLGATIFGFVPMAAWMYDARSVWPLSEAPAYTWLALDPASFWKVDLLPFTMSFVMPNDLQFPFTAAWTLGVAAGVVLVLYLAMSGLRIMREKRNWPLAKQGFASLSIVALLGLSWFDMSYDYLRPKTLLVEQKVWQIPSALDEPYGIAYLNGKVYITSFSRAAKGYIGILDVNSGAYTALEAQLNGTKVAFEHPSDIKVGPDGLLYVLNNGADTDALWVLKPTGEVVRKIALNGKTPIATGLYLGADGSYYVADMLGGKVLMFKKDGGDVAGVWGGEKGGFNNPSGVAVDETGEVFAAENGYGYIHELKPDGTFVRKYDMKCQPTHAVANGDWIDISCSNGFVSINAKGHFIQLSRFEPLGTKPIVPRGLTYGEGNTLYMLDASNNMIMSYKVTH